MQACDTCGRTTERVWKHANGARTRWVCADCHPDVDGLDFLEA